MLEEELWSFMKAVRLPNFARKLLPGLGSAPSPSVPRWDWAPPPLVVEAAPLGGWRVLGASTLLLGALATGSESA